MQRFRLTDSRGQAIEFNADTLCLASRVNGAYLSYCQNNSCKELILEVLHSQHGWQPVYNTKGYCRTIVNPFQLDYEGLKNDIHNTLAIISTWPTRKQLLRHTTEKRRHESNLRALERRACFRVYNNPLPAAVTPPPYPQKREGVARK